MTSQQNSTGSSTGALGTTLDTTTNDGPPAQPQRMDTLPTYSELRARLLLAQSLISHRLDADNPDVAAVLAVLRGDLSLAGVE